MPWDVMPRVTQTFSQVLAAEGPGAASEPGPLVPKPVTRPAGRDPRDALTDYETEVRLDHVTFEKAVEILRDQWGVNIVVDWFSLQGDIERKTPVEMRLWNVRLSQVLTMLLEETDEHQRADWTVEDGVIRIGATQELHRIGVVKVYDVRDLIEEWASYRRQHPSTQPGTGVFGGEREDEEVFQNLVQETLALAGTQHTWSGRLIVCDTPEAHRKVAEFLSQLRATKKA